MPLYVVATPIGNLKDITLRALEVLKVADLIVCEDTRRTKKLLNHYDIQYKMITSLNNYNEKRKTPHIIALLEEGKLSNDNEKLSSKKGLQKSETFEKGLEKSKTSQKEVVLVSDNGTPGICDPGSFLIKEAINKEITIVPVPGPNAAITALACSGLLSEQFTFYGFLPKKKGQKEKIVQQIKERQETAVLYESPYRMNKTLSILKEFIPERTVTIARELTKRHEEFITGKILDICEKYKNKEWKGEIVIILGN